MNRDEALTAAGSLINGDRARDYGDARTNFQRIADLWAPILDTPVIPEQVALCLAQLKVARLIQSPGHADSWVDGLGYLALGAELATGEAGGSSEDSEAAETGTKPAEQGFRVGARVRVHGRESEMAGELIDKCGEIVGETDPDGEWVVALDELQGMRYFDSSELEVIQ